MSTQGWSRVRRKGKGKTDASAISITLIVEHYGGEVKQGRNVSVKCCMHHDTRRSAVIDTYGNLYFCHTCGKGGSAIDVVMEKEGLGFKDAVNRAEEIVAGRGDSLQQQPKRAGKGLSRRTWNI